ncbi:MAG TPA: XRE family transcriptional regulator [Polyangiaceae bacterium]|nr:XRE family transcriptional regulator [Polyangiaceae bacterium]
MSPADIRKLRAELDCSVGELAGTLGVEVKTVLAWESGDLFPTKKHADRLTAMAREGASAVVRKARPSAQPKRGLAALSEPRLWAVVRKLAAYPDFLTEVERLGERYDEPKDD